MRLRQRPNRQGPDSRQAGSTRQTGSRQTMSRQTGSRETGLGWWAGAGRRVGRAPQSAHHSGLEGTVGCTTFTKRVQGHRRLHDISWQAHTVQACSTSHTRRRGTAVASRTAHQPGQEQRSRCRVHRPLGRSPFGVPVGQCDRDRKHKLLLDSFFAWSYRPRIYPYHIISTDKDPRSSSDRVSYPTVHIDRVSLSVLH
jgi:hypothetical protein